MGTHLRFIPALAVIGAFALGGPSAARAQDTSSVRADTSAYRSYEDTAAADTGGVAGPTGRADTGAYQYNGPAADTALKAKPGVQTGPAARDSGEIGQKSEASKDTVVCKDGSNSPRTGEACLKHGGIDWVATEAARKARGETITTPADSADSGTAAPTDTSSGR